MDEQILSGISTKLNVLISLSLRQLSEDRDFSQQAGRKGSVGEAARYLADLGLEPKDIAQILRSPLPSIRTLLTPGRRK
jgi:hypothetical protein